MISELDNIIFLNERLEDLEISSVLRNGNIAVFGAAGTVGSAIVRQLLEYEVKKIVIIDQDDVGLYELYRGLTIKNNNKVTPILNNMYD